MIYFVLLSCVLSLKLHWADASGNFQASPSIIEVDSTSSLTVNCSFTYSLTSNISHLISIIISKSDSGDYNSFHELTSISTVDPDLPAIVDPSVNSTVSGRIDNSEVSYLSLHWSYPTVKEAGLYRCIVNGVDNIGHPADVSYTVQVTGVKPDIDLLIEIVRDQQLEVQDIRKTLADFGTILNKLLTSVDQLVTKQIHSEAAMNQFNYSLRQIGEKVCTNFDFLKSEEYNGKYYFYSKSEVADVSVSQRNCEEVGGYLAEINDANENNFIKGFMNKQSPSPQAVLIGGTNDGHANQWTWRQSRTPFYFQDWHSGSPDNEVNLYHCVFLFKSFSWQWINWPCSSSTNFLCEV